MAKTPEGLIKAQVRDLFAKYKLLPSSKAATVFNLDRTEYVGWYHMPMQAQMSVAGIPDFYGHFHGLFFVVETKADEKKQPTPHQKHQIHATQITGAKSFVVGGPASLDLLERWLIAVEEWLKYKS